MFFIIYQADTDKWNAALVLAMQCFVSLKIGYSLYETKYKSGHSFDDVDDVLVYQELHAEILESINGAPSTLTPLVFEKKKPIPMKMFTPKIVEM